MIDGVLHKACTRCGEFLPSTTFNRNPTAKDGRVAVCRQCLAPYFHAHYLAHRDEKRQREHERWVQDKAKISARNRQYRVAHKEQLREKYAAWHSLNREHIRAQQRAYRQLNMARRREAHRNWCARNVERLRKTQHANYLRHYAATGGLPYMEAWRRRDAMKRAVRVLYGHHTTSEWKAKLSEYGARCAHCGTTERITRDHIIPLSRGGTDLITNIQPLCIGCNVRKGDSMPSTLNA